MSSTGAPLRSNQRDGGLGRMIGRLHKDMPPAEREEAVRKFAKGDFQVLMFDASARTLIHVLSWPRVLVAHTKKISEGYSMS